PSRDTPTALGRSPSLSTHRQVATRWSMRFWVRDDFYRETTPTSNDLAARGASRKARVPAAAWRPEDRRDGARRCRLRDRERAGRTEPHGRGDARPRIDVPPGRTAPPHRWGAGRGGFAMG